MDKAIIFFTRAPLAGQTKTRLMPYLDGSQCAELHAELIKKIYAVCKRAEGGGAEIILAYTPDSGQEALARIIPEHFAGDHVILRQRGEGIGERMENAFTDVFALGFQEVLLIGSDIPEITEKIIAQAFAALEDKDIVINPTLDGGYYLIGMKQPHHELWNIRQYGAGSVFADTCAHIRRLKLSYACGSICRDIDSREDLLAYRSRGGDPDSCMHCGACTDSCLFLKKYGLDLAGLAKRPELAYSCFLCGRCREVCPLGIDGEQIALRQRQERAFTEQGKKSLRAAYRGILLEKNPYIFANYKKGAYREVLFPGCNFTAFFPQTMKYLQALMQAHDIGVVYDCCQKPVAQLGLYHDSVVNLRQIEKKLRELRVEELIVICPNCYHYLKERISIPLKSIYKKLHELGLGRMLETENLQMFFPCPERSGGEIFAHLQLFLDAETKTAFDAQQCCGLGGCAQVREPKLARDMADASLRTGKPLYTYCASCVSSFRRQGHKDVYHLLPLILGVEEEIPLGLGSLLNRAKRKFK